MGLSLRSKLVQPGSDAIELLQFLLTVTVSPPITAEVM